MGVPAEELNIKTMINKKFIIVTDGVRDREEILHKLSGLLKKEGYVKESFYGGIMEREKKFPTGLETQTVNIAMPHTDPEHVNKPAIAIAVLKEPVEFNRMDKPTETVKVNILFMLAPKEKANQVGLIESLISAVESPDLLPAIKECESVEEVRNKLISYFS